MLIMKFLEIIKLQSIKMLHIVLIFKEKKKILKTAWLVTFKSGKLLLLPIFFVAGFP